MSIESIDQILSQLRERAPVAYSPGQPSYDGRHKAELKQRIQSTEELIEELRGREASLQDRVGEVMSRPDADDSLAESVQRERDDLRRRIEREELRLRALKEREPEAIRADAQELVDDIRAPLAGLIVESNDASRRVEKRVAELRELLPTSRPPGLRDCRTLLGILARETGAEVDGLPAVEPADGLAGRLLDWLEKQER